MGSTERYFDVMRPEVPGLSMSKTIELADTLLSHGGRDIYTGGIDIAVVRKPYTRHYLRQINTNLEKARKRAINDVVKDIGK